MDAQLKKISDQIVAGMKKQLGDSWVQLTAFDQELISNVADDAAALSIRAAGSPNDPTIAEEQQQITAQLANIEAATEIKAVTTFWTVTQAVMNKAVAVATTALIAAV